MTHSMKINLNLINKHSKLDQMKVSLSVLCILGYPGEIRLARFSAYTIGVKFLGKIILIVSIPDLYPLFYFENKNSASTFLIYPPP